MPDFGIFRGFNEKLFSDKLFAGQLPIELGNNYDADAQNFFSRVSIAGGILSVTEQLAINQLVLDLKSNSLWSKMKAIYPMVGASAAACAQNLKSSSFTGTFNGGWTYDSLGVTGNGSSGYIDTGLKPNANLSLNSVSMGFYSRTLKSGSNFSDCFGGVSNSGYNNGFYLLPMSSFSSNQFDYSRVNSNSAIAALRYSSVLGFFQISRIASTEFRSARNTTQFVNNIVSSGLSGNNIFISALNNNNIAEEYSRNQCAYYYIGDGLTSTEMDNNYALVQKFQSKLSRNV